MNHLFSSKASVLTAMGWLNITVDDEAVTEISFAEEAVNNGVVNDTLILALQEMEGYLEGRLKEFTVRLAPAGTPFQQKVWQELRKIPYGKTITYQELAVRLGDEKSIRAAASANGKNPIAIIIPCHRVIGSDGSMTGYAAGVERKSWLLHLENGVSAPTLFEPANTKHE
jgi:methylated-DNA-[protein]-cysteine S-methyltransferase